MGSILVFEPNRSVRIPRVWIIDCTSPIHLQRFLLFRLIRLSPSSASGPVMEAPTSPTSSNTIGLHRRYTRAA